MSHQPSLIAGGGTHPVTLRYDTRVTTCAGPGCANAIDPQPTGRPARYCSTACRVRDYRQRQRLAAAPIAIEVDMGSATSRGRVPEHAWLVRIRRGDRSVIIAAGLRRGAADRLAEQLADLLTDTPQPKGAVGPRNHGGVHTVDGRRR